MPITSPAPAHTRQRPPGLRNTPPGWLAAAAAGLDEDGMIALFTSTPRDTRKRRAGPADRADAASSKTEDVA